jgi:hypothetical protein
VSTFLEGTLFQRLCSVLRIGDQANDLWFKPLWEAIGGP